ncbi:MAG TPA: cytochrome c [Planctomycetota bacterium]|jgi:nitric oxide reductase subunit C|nr:cytochrome c [Planctomycetota bacterium]
MEPSSRKLMVMSLIGIFAGQTWLVYSDPAGRVAPPLSELALEGRKVWHDYNCQSCHQLFGFGGFLGPDLTNLAEEMTPARYEVILTEGRGLMPSLDLKAEECDAIAAFLTEIDATGVGQLRIGDSLSDREVMAAWLAECAPESAPLTAEQHLGAEVVLESACISCHLPNPASALGAPDLTLAATRFSEEELLRIVTEGIPAKGMPAISLDDQQRTALYSFLEWAASHGDRLASRFASNQARQTGGFASIPWFEYE